MHLREFMFFAVHGDVDSNAHVNEAPRGRIANVFQFCDVAQCQGLGAWGGAAAKQLPGVWREAQRVLEVDEVKEAFDQRLAGLCVGTGQDSEECRPGAANEDIGRDSSAHLSARHRTMMGNVGGAEVNVDCCGPGINLR